MPSSSCVVCGTSIPAPSPANPSALPVCRAVACQWAFRTTPEHRRCRMCGRPVADGQLAERVCLDDACRRRWIVEQQRAHVEHLRRERERFEARARELRAESAAAMGIDRPDEYVLTRLPRYTGRVTRLPRRRVREFREHLRDKIDEALAQRAAERDQPAVPAPPPPPLSPELSALFGQGCARCRGECCGNGGTHAYVRADGIRRYMDAHPDRTPDEVLETYMSHVGTRTFEGSCVYHGARGCTLPRDMRANICNSFLCEGLTHLRQALDGTGAPARAFYAAARADRMTAAFVDVRDVRVVRRGREARPRPIATG